MEFFLMTFVLLAVLGAQSGERDVRHPEPSVDAAATFALPDPAVSPCLAPAVRVAVRQLSVPPSIKDSDYEP